MIIHTRNKVIPVAEIPKSGSRSLVKAATIKYGKHNLSDMGHGLTADNLAWQAALLAFGTSATPVTPMAVVREPVSRLVSILNHIRNNCLAGQRTELADAEYITGQCHIITHPQVQWVGLPEDRDCTLFPMDKISSALLHITDGAIDFVHVNKMLNKVWTMDTIETHSYYRDMLDVYTADFELYEAAVG